MLVAMRAIPLLLFSVEPFVFKTDGNPIARKTPKFLHQAIVQFLRPLSPQKGLDRFPSLKEFGAIPPLRIDGVSPSDNFRVARVPRILSRFHLCLGSFESERRLDDRRHFRSSI